MAQIDFDPVLERTGYRFDKLLAAIHYGKRIASAIDDFNWTPGHVKIWECRGLSYYTEILEGVEEELSEGLLRILKSRNTLRNLVRRHFPHYSGRGTN